MSWDAPYPEWPLPQGSDPLFGTPALGALQQAAFVGPLLPGAAAVTPDFANMPGLSFGEFGGVSIPWTFEPDSGTKNPQADKDAAQNALASQILGQKLTDKWSGQGFGSAEANAKDMARILSGIGITDIKQFGEFNKTEKMPVTTGHYETRNVLDEYGNTTGQTQNVFVEGSGEPGYFKTVQESHEAGDGYSTSEYSVFVPLTAAEKEKVKNGVLEIDTGQKVYGNKETKQEVPNTYSERQTGNAWGGTFAGEGNTGYRVQFGPDGTPYFYTTGASSSDLGKLAPILAIAQFIPGVAPFAMAANAAIAISQGDVLGGLASLAGAGGFTDAATALRVANAVDKGNMGAIAASLLQNETVGKLASDTMLTDTISLADAGNAFNVVDNVNKGNYAGALTAAGALTSSSDLKTVGAGLNLINAIDSGNEVAIINAAAGLNTAVQAANNLSNPGVARSIADTVASGGGVANAGGGGSSDESASNASKVVADNASTTPAANAVDTGASTFVAAKNAGASDNDAMAAANTVTGKTANTEFGNLAGAQADAAARSTVAISNAEADNPQEAAAAAKARNPEATSFTYNGQTYQMSASNAQVAQAATAAEADRVKNDIANAKTFNEAYATARQALGANQTFTWNGQTFNTNTADEQIAALNKTNLATNTAASAQTDARSVGAINAADANLQAISDTNLANMSPEMRAIVKAQNDQTARDAAARDLAARTAKATTAADDLVVDTMGNTVSGSQNLGSNELLQTTAGRITNGVADAMTNFLGVVANSPVAAVQAGGNLLGNVGGIIDLVAGTSTEAGDKLRSLAGQVDKFSDSISDPQIKAQQQKIGADIEKADGLMGKTAALISSAYENPLGAANWVLTEAFEEVPGVGMALKAGNKISRYGIALANDMIESGGSAYNDTYKAAIAQGMTESEAREAARNSSLTAMVATGATAGLVEGKVLGKVAGKNSAGELVEGSAQAAGSQLALGQDLDVNKILTQGVIEMGVGKGASSTANAVTSTNIESGNAGATSTGDATTAPATTAAAAAPAATTSTSDATQASTDFSSIFLSTGDASAAAATTVDAAVKSGTDVAAAVGSTVTAAADAGGTTAATTALDSAVSTAVAGGADVAATVNTAVDAAVAGGVTSNVAAATAANAAVVAGADAGTASTVASTAANNTAVAATNTVVTTAATTDINTTVTTAASSGADVAAAVTSTVTAAVDAGADVTAAVNTAVTAAANAGADVGAAVTSSVAAAVTAGADANTAVTSAVTAAVNAGADAGATITSSVAAAVDAGANVSAVADSAVTAAVTAAVTSGADAGAAVNSSVTAAVTSGADAGTAITAAVTAAVTAGADTNAVVTAAVTAAVDAGMSTTAATSAATDAATTAATNATADTGVNTTVNTVVDASTNTAATTATNPATNVTTTVTTDPATNTSTVTNVNKDSNVTTSTTTDPSTNVTTNTVVNTKANADLKVSVNVDASTGAVISVNGPGTVIDKDTVVVDGTAIDVNTGAILTPQEVNERKKAAVEKTQIALARSGTGSDTGTLTFKAPTYPAKDSNIVETWLGGRFRNAAPLAGLSALLPESTPMFQEAQALSALRRASGVEDKSAETPEADYYAYGSEPSFAKVLQPYMNGGTVQNHAGGGKIMASPLMAASGGDVPHKGSHYVQGAGGGQDDLIPAKLADGEYVFDAEIVAALGDGSNKEGAKKLDAMREAIRKHKRGGSLKSIPPKAKSPLAYMKGGL